MGRNVILIIRLGAKNGNKDYYNIGSHVDVKGCVKVLREQERSRAESLINALRYTTKHLNEDTTPKSTKSLLFEEMT
jgi:hypothetical protein